MSKKNLVITVLYIWFGFITMLTVLIGVKSGMATLSYNGIAVDSEGRLYVGAEHEIVVYQEGQKVLSISPHTSRAYIFTIEDDKILLSTAAVVYQMDLEGNVLSEWKDEGTKTYNRLQKTRKYFVTADGKEYRMKNFLCPARVECDGDVIFVESMGSFLVRLLWWLSILSLLFLFPYCIYLWYKRMKKKNSRIRYDDCLEDDE